MCKLSGLIPGEKKLPLEKVVLTAYELKTLIIHVPPHLEAQN